MKRAGHLFETLVSWPNLLDAARKARRGKRRRPNVTAFEFHRERELLRLQSALSSGGYRPGPFRSFVLREPKERRISAAPYRDRVVHHALCNVIEPLFEPGFIHDSYACRAGKGTHAAIGRAQQFARRFPWVLKGDVAAFFPSADHQVLLARLGRRLKDRRVLNLAETILRHPFPGRQPPRPFVGDDLFTPLERTCGLPIGNQTSQFFGNVLLDALDHFVKEELRCAGYVRYADDFLLFASNPTVLHGWRESVRQHLLSLRLRLHPKKSVVFPVADGIPFLGVRVFPHRRRLSKRSLLKFRRRLRQLQQDLAAGRIEWEDVRRYLVSWRGHARAGHAEASMRRILIRTPFRNPSVGLVKNRAPDRLLGIPAISRRR